MNLSNYEKENVINFNEAERDASIYTFNKPMRRRLERLAAEHPEECTLHRLSSDGLAAEYYIPKGWIKINPPRVASEAQKNAARTALAKVRKG